MQTHACASICNSPRAQMHALTKGSGRLTMRTYRRLRNCTRAYMRRSTTDTAHLCMRTCTHATDALVAIANTYYLS